MYLKTMPFVMLLLVGETVSSLCLEKRLKRALVGRFCVAVTCLDTLIYGELGRGVADRVSAFCGFSFLRIGRSADLPICMFANLRICRFADVQFVEWRTSHVPHYTTHSYVT
jgi:hypothetical protein